MIPKFNPKLPYGQVFGQPGVMYDQGGVLFNAEKLACDLAGKPLEEEAPAPAPDPAPAPAIEQQPQGGDPNAQNQDPADVIDESVNLAAWLDGSKKYAFGQVQAEIQKAYDVIVKSKAEAIALLNDKLGKQEAAPAPAQPEQPQP